MEIIKIEFKLSLDIKYMIESMQKTTSNMAYFIPSSSRTRKTITEEKGDRPQSATSFSFKIQGIMKSLIIEDIDYSNVNEK
jgi:hypothetical protein